MVRGTTRFVWALAACAAVVAQVMPKALCQACDQPCCAGGSAGQSAKVSDVGVEPAGHCPLCDVGADRRPTETTERPCTCQLKARGDQPVSLWRGGRPALADGHTSIGPAGVASVVPPVLRLSREYVAASLAVPIRPLRILCGVWRN